MFYTALHGIYYIFITITHLFATLASPIDHSNVLAYYRYACSDTSDKCSLWLSLLRQSHSYTSDILTLINCTSLLLQLWHTHYYKRHTGFYSLKILTFTALTSTKCKWVQKPHTNLTDTPVDHTGAYKYLQILSGPPGAKQCALTLCNIIPRCD